jgi:predicted phosphate transport protein (TIGR00153 family)
MNGRLKHLFDQGKTARGSERTSRSQVRGGARVARQLAFAGSGGYKPRPMLRRFLPREEDFFSLFERHAALTVDGAQQFAKLVSGGQNVKALAARIKEIEHETDVITHTCVERLHTVFITPIDRDDIHRLITRMDDVMDYVESASERIALYELREMTDEVRELADVLVRATQTLVTAVGGLRDLKKTQIILDACIEVNRLENEGDEILRNAVAKLFREATDPLFVMKWKEVYEALESATDRCEDVANIIEGVILEHA